MKRIGLTGGIACGKSAFAADLAACGCDVLDADAIVHRLEEPGGAATAPILAAFGPDMRAREGGIDRARLAAKVFADAAARERLNAIVHPLVRETLARWLAAPGSRPKVAVVPLLFEVGWEREWDEVVCVACSEAEQVRRLRQRGLTEAQARARLAAQMPLAEKVRRAHRVVWNDGSLSALRNEAARMAEEWLEKRK
jgi:dephospho-CoA kinase